MDVFIPNSPGVPANPELRDEIWLVDNGSTDDSVAYVKEEFPWVRIFRLPQNMGFSQAYNQAVDACQAHWVVFLNNDTTVAPDWLSRLHACASHHARAAAVASCMLNADGTKIDFVGGDTFFFGQAYQKHLGEPVANCTFKEHQLLFGCAGALMVRRSVFLELGGFDPDYFSFFEDVDLGWRLNLAGHEVWFCPHAVVFHRGHGTWGTSITPAKRILLERNGLANVFKNWGDERVGVFLLFSEILTFLRGLTAYGTPCPTNPPKFTVETLSHLFALTEFAHRLPVLEARREQLAKIRKRGDDEVLPLFGSLTGAPTTGNPTFERLYRYILWRCELLGPQKLPRWTHEINVKALALAKQLAIICHQALQRSRITRAFLEEQDPQTEHVVPLSLAQTVFRLRGVLEQFLLKPLDLASLSWLTEQCTGLQLRPEGEPPVEVSWENPTVSVIVRTKDRPAFLSQALGSIAAQTRKPNEVLVVNDGGVDPSPVVSPFATSLTIRLVNLLNSRGRTWAAQTGLLTAQGAVVGFLDDDDQWLPQHLEVLLGALAHGARVTYADVEVLRTDAGGCNVVARGILGGEFDPVALLFENYIPIIAVLFQKELALSVGGFDTSLDYFEDWDLWVRLAQAEHFLHCPVVTARYFVRPAFGHGEATGGDHRWSHMARVFEKHKHLVSGWTWAEYFRKDVEATRQHRNQLAQQLENILKSRSWRLMQRIRRVLGRG